MLALAGHLEGVYLGFAASVRVQKQGLGRYSHWDGPVDFLEEVVDDGGRRFARFFATRILCMDFLAVRMTFHK